MSIEAELIVMSHSMDRMATAMENLTDAIQEMTVTNQKVLMVLLEYIAGDDEELKVATDMEGNPI